MSIIFTVVAEHKDISGHEGVVKDRIGFGDICSADFVNETAAADEFICEIAVSWTKETTGEGAYIEFETTNFSEKGICGDDVMEGTGSESEGDEGIGRTEGRLSDEMESTVRDEFVG